MIHAIIPLSVLEAIRNLDTPVEDGLEEFADELLVKRLGLSPTVRKQITLYEHLVARDAMVGPEDATALLRLVGRREDHALVFADAGRRAARRAARRLLSLTRALTHLPGALGRAAGFAAIRRAGRDVFGARVERRGNLPTAVIKDPVAVAATPNGDACALYAAAFAELVRLLLGFEGAMLHEECRARGADRCRWTATAVGGVGR
jgi:predicted hydrocarbon binding protein